MDLQQTREWEKYLTILGWQVKDVGKPSSGVIAGKRKLPLIPWWIIKIQRVESGKIDWSKVEAWQKQHPFTTTYLELNDHQKISGYHQSIKGMLPTKTQIIDLRCEIKELLAQMKAKTRYNIKIAISNQLTVNSVNTVNDELIKLLVRNSWRVGLWGMDHYWLRAEAEAFKEKSFMVKISKDRELLAAAYFLETKTTAYYRQNGSSEKGRQLMAPTLAVWEGIKEAKKRGLIYFDFDGVSDERWPIKTWKGFTRFKEGFGGKAVYYPPVLVKHSIWGLNW